MRLVILSVATILASVVGVSLARAPDTAVLSPPTTRLGLLRNSNDNDEERMISLYKFKNIFRSGNNENNQLTVWLKDKQSADKVFGLLKLDDGADNVLTHSKFKAWESYISMFNNKYPNDEMHMIDMLTKRYGDDVVSRMIEAVKTKPGMEKLAGKLQTDLFRGWFRQSKSPDDVLRILKLDDPANIDKGNLDAWLKFLDVFNKRFPNSRTNMLDSFERAYGNEIGLAKKLATVQKPNGAQPNDVEVALFSKWLKKKMNRKAVVTKVFKLQEGEELKDKNLAVFLLRFSSYYTNAPKPHKRVRFNSQVVVLGQ
ncbi:secreted RxLR effector peptide protein, putative [Phytophthora infestans T30-4]|uniref:Secreted RxLR effector peptide protein, putative n=2 Tax=Phytophthora infestans TaxID=4787 RepID=D0N130_PHYIT|nr:secreted RxLR effector peptide protein, putative [Phytophthora infestans T30-4]EEY67343.1 secreted RxLR effector peptide protein, putative [Phytophthora infestans T30-4]KAF4045576.1 hypothetical protein GN244_ATG02024 [Phytophthora infestans]|eukprot:XP_002905991.1 secreted RxLR effector peptide protein, putative [Phytophthora infestans T30-4]